MKRLRITLEGKTYEVAVEVIEDSSLPVSGPCVVPSPAVSLHPAAAASVQLSSAAAAMQIQAGCTQVVSPMAGKVFKCPVKPGDRVTQQQVVLILEAMKMETPIHAPLAGVVRSVQVNEGDAVDEGQLLLQIEG